MEPALTLPRHLYRAVLRLLRPLEAATRRLVVVAARGLTVPNLPPPRVRKLRPKPKSIFVRNGVGTGIVLPRGVPLPPQRPARRTWSLPMADPLKRFGPRRRTVPPHRAPRILFLDGPYRPLPPPPSPDDPVDATRLSLRLAGIGRALADLPREARRFARWKARRDAGLIRRVSPLRPGLAPGLSGATSRRPTHEVHEILKDMQYFAREALEHPDTS